MHSRMTGYTQLTPQRPLYFYYIEHYIKNSSYCRTAQQCSVKVLDKIKCMMLLRDKGLQSCLQKIVTFMFQALVLVHNIVTSIWHIYFCCTALCCLLLCFYSIVTHSKAGNCHFDVSGFYREAKYLHFLPIFDNLIKGTQRQLSAILRPKIENLDPFLVESSPISFFADCILSNTFTEHY